MLDGQTSWRDMTVKSLQCGRAQHDTIHFDDLGFCLSNFGHRDAPRVDGIDIYHDKTHCFGFQIIYDEDRPGPLNISKEAKSQNNELQISYLRLQKGEYFTDIRCRTDNRVCYNIILETNLGRIAQGGGIGGHLQESEIPQTMDKRYAVIAMGGGFGQKMHCLHAHYIDLTKLTS